MLFILNGNSVPSVASIIHVNQPTDTTPPAVSVTAPANGASVSGNVSLTANATDNTSIDNVQYKLDGANLGTKQFGERRSRFSGQRTGRQRFARDHGRSD
jgi:hypothetical protein